MQEGITVSYTVILVVTALISGLIATGVSIWWQSRHESKRRKYGVFETLMKFRTGLVMPESVGALNLVDVVFYNDKKVRTAYKEFLDEADKPEDGKRDIDAKYLKLLEEIAFTIGLRDIQWDTIKKYYYPVGMANKLNEEMKLRQLQITLLSLQLDEMKQSINPRIGHGGAYV